MEKEQRSRASDSLPRKKLKVKRPSKENNGTGIKNAQGQPKAKQRGSCPSLKGQCAVLSLTKTSGQLHNGFAKRKAKNDENEQGSSQPSATSPDATYKNKRIQVGKAFQAVIPQLISKSKSKTADEHPATLTWKPTDKLKGDEIEGFVSLAKVEFGYKEEQALGLLYYKNYDLKKAKWDLPNFAPSSDQFTEEENMLFDSEIVNSEKDLQHVSGLLPHKPFSSIVLHYYQWKVQEKNRSLFNISESNTAQQNVSKCFQPQHPLPSPLIFGGDTQLRCANCRFRCEEDTITYNLCNVCYIYWMKTGNMRAVITLLNIDTKGYKCGRTGNAEAAATPPKGMNIDLNALDSVAISSSSKIAEGLNKQIHNIRGSIQKGKQKVEEARTELPKDGAMSQYRRQT